MRRRVEVVHIQSRPLMDPWRRDNFRMVVWLMVAALCVGFWAGVIFMLVEVVN